MIPILYESTETEFESNGLGRLRDCISCIVTEERNSIYECDFEYPVGGHNYDQIRLGRIIAVEHDDTNDIQPFDIVSMTRPINGIVQFHAVHISYRQSKMVASGTDINSLSDAFDMLSNATPFNPFVYVSDEDQTGYMAAADGTPRSVRQLLGGVEGSILDTYRGEYEWDKWRVILHQNRGTEKDFTIRYGVDLVDYSEETDYSESYSSVIPYWKGADSSVVGSIVTAAGATYNGRNDCVPLDLTDKFETQPTTAQLESYAQSYIDSSNCLLPKQSITVDFVRLADSIEYQALTNLYRCSLCDTIKVDFPMYNTQGRFKIVKTVYNVLREKFDEMELGTLSTTLSEALGISDSVSNASTAVVVQSGTDGIWTYRKWSDGTAECWGNTTGPWTATFTQQATGVYSNTDWRSKTVSLPAGLFTSVQYGNVAVQTSGYSSAQVNGLATGSIAFRVWNAYAVTNMSIYGYQLEVKGKWR